MKTKCMILRAKLSQKIQTQFTYGEDTLANTDTYTYLGLDFILPMVVQSQLYKPE